MIKLLQLVLLLEVFLIPLVGPGVLGFEQTKVILFFILTSLSGLIWLYLIYSRQISLKFDSLDIWVVVFLVWLLISSLLGINPLVSLLGAQPYLQGWLTYFFLGFFYLIFKSARIPIKTVAIIFAWSAVIVSLEALKEWVFIYLWGDTLPSYGGRVVSTFGQPNLFSGFLLLALPLSWFLYRQASKIYLLCLGCEVLGIFISGSRAAIFGLVILFLGLGFYQIKKSTVRFKNGLLVALLALLILTGMFFVKQNFQQEYLFNQQWLIHNAPEKRLLFWPIFFQLFAQRPIFGYGLENIDQSFTYFFQSVNFNTLNNPVFYSLKDLNLDRTHNFILDLLITSGVVGLLIWIYIFFLKFRTENYLLKILLITYLLWIQFQPQGIVQLLFFWLLLAT